LLTLTSAALSPAVRTSVEVFAGIYMFVWAVRGEPMPSSERLGVSPFLDTIPLIISGRPQKQVLGSNTLRIVAVMANIHAVRYEPVLQFPREPV
jgi:hypothetical protein